uniref:Type 1 phosphatases regulator n=1 Tax=Grammatophora oceanica TaxID=210454 RepID=A0A7S1Y5A8_9STRA|mmetsp:Transcript_27413/g.40218  ORF Transcript_27413/g.40218 Transcript_27413/m.40218 type:complete len:154 (+) Transcript_27413:23-484(+)
MTTPPTATQSSETPASSESQPLSGGISQHGGNSQAAAAAAAAPSATMTMTESAVPPVAADEVLTLTLQARPSVRWDENVVDNEGLGRKSSKRCCIFHKQRAFDESSTDSSDYDSDNSQSSDGDDDGKGDQKKKPSKRIAHPKKKVPDYQRFHA